MWPSSYITESFDKACKKKTFVNKHSYVCFRPMIYFIQSQMWVSLHGTKWVLGEGADSVSGIRFLENFIWRQLPCGGCSAAWCTLNKLCCRGLCRCEAAAEKCRSNNTVDSSARCSGCSVHFCTSARGTVMNIAFVCSNARSYAQCCQTTWRI